MKMDSSSVESPEPGIQENCPICLGRMVDACYLEGCKHSFCFDCLKTWSEERRSCPVCRTAYDRILHIVETEDDLQEYLVPEPVSNMDDEDDDFIFEDSEESDFFENSEEFEYFVNSESEDENESMEEDEDPCLGTIQGLNETISSRFSSIFQFLESPFDDITMALSEIKAPENIEDNPSSSSVEDVLSVFTKAYSQFQYFYSVIEANKNLFDNFWKDLQDQYNFLESMIIHHRLRKLNLSVLVGKLNADVRTIEEAPSYVPLHTALDLIKEFRKESKPIKNFSVAFWDLLHQTIYKVEDRLHYITREVGTNARVFSRKKASWIEFLDILNSELNDEMIDDLDIVKKVKNILEDTWKSLFDFRQQALLACSIILNRSVAMMIQNAELKENIEEVIETNLEEAYNRVVVVSLFM